MTDVTPNFPSEPTRISAERYFALVREGVLAEEDRVELLEGVIVAVPPMDPKHAWAISRVDAVLQRLVPAGATVRVQCPLVAGAHSVPEPDIAIVPGTAEDWRDRHPTAALLVVEVSASSLPQDRLTKAVIYAHAAIPEYWILNLAEDRIEVRRDPDPRSGRYRSLRIAAPGQRIEPGFARGVAIDVRDLLPAPPTA